MKEATMVYRLGGEHLIHGHQVDYQVIDADEVGDALADGWFLTAVEAGESVPVGPTLPPVDVVSPPTRAELDAKAKELGIKFDGRTTDKKLGDLIAEKLKA